ncbi:unnamed protein product [Rotaria magnacalcarata]|uniref:Uncharacterized protein n=2 Tax=Rotaria magnacalcarata TaxID=392030 RepID=A0A816M357_9BILA|nr:unnamed protein product [Rotaria magnacalcarata]CAF2251443.1 unnamed protein product [Rotaria magnacalcarata]CAF3751156.1 unnamed protein product [Rotaria magnacalcarata]CAF3754329.1 unnamed protein product [Rotaria magnacalcarata]
MTSWQNILDNLPTGAGRPAAQHNNNKHISESPHRISNDVIHNNESPPRSRQGRERQLVFLPRKRNVVPKFNLLALKPTEDCQPYNMGFFQPHGLVEDETVWKKSLRDLAMSLGFITQNEIDRIQKPATLSNFYGPPSTTGSLRTSAPSTSAGPTPRFNEPLPPPSRGERLFAKGFAKPSWYYKVDDHEREAWMLQVLCQILGTEDIALVQTWLASSHKAERDLARQLIVRALDGLGEGDRFRTILPSLDVDMDTLNNFVNGIAVPQIPVDGVFRPTLKRPKRRGKLRSLDENKPVHDSRTEEELMAEFSSPTLAVMQTTPNTSIGPGDTARLRTPFLPPIPARWMMHNDGSFRTPPPKKAASESDLSRSAAWENSSYPTNVSSVFS